MFRPMAHVLLLSDSWMAYLESQGDLISRLMVGITRAITWVARVALNSKP